MLHHLSTSGFSVLVLASVVATQDFGFFEAQSYLKEFGYLQNGSEDMEAMVDEDALQESIIGFQTFMGLEQTGILDSETITMMTSPRCGMADTEPSLGYRRKRGAAWHIKWNKPVLTYRISKYSRRYDKELTDRDVQKAFQVWSNVVPLQFRKVSNVEVKADLDIRFEQGAHDTRCTPFDGSALSRGKVLAHAFFPTTGIIHFDDDETWTMHSQGINFFQVAVHEFGHALGLRHSDVQGAIMYPSYFYSSNFQLHQDDISTIQGLYGLKTTRTPTNNNPREGGSNCRPGQGRHVSFPPFPNVPGLMPPFPNVPGRMPQFPNVPGRMPPFVNVPGLMPPFPNVPGRMPQFPNVPGRMPPLPNVPGRMPPLPNVPGRMPPFPNVPGRMPPFPNVPGLMPPFPNVPGRIPPFHNPPYPKRVLVQFDFNKQSNNFPTHIDPFKGFENTGQEPTTASNENGYDPADGGNFGLVPTNEDGQTEYDSTNEGYFGLRPMNEDRQTEYDFTNGENFGLEPTNEDGQTGYDFTNEGNFGLEPTNEDSQTGYDFTNEGNFGLEPTNEDSQTGYEFNNEGNFGLEQTNEDSQTGYEFTDGGNFELEQQSVDNYY